MNIKLLQCLTYTIEQNRGQSALLYENVMWTFCSSCFHISHGWVMYVVCIFYRLFMLFAKLYFSWLSYVCYLIFQIEFIIGIWKPIPTDKVLFVLCSDLFPKNKKPCFYYMTKLKNWTFICVVISKWDWRHIRRKLKVSYYFNKCKPETIPPFTLMVFWAIIRKKSDLGYYLFLNVFL
jgi:hypothetical protein